VTERVGLFSLPAAARLLLLGGAVGPVLFVIVVFIEGATRPGYNQLRNYVSDLSLSGFGWMQVVNFVVCGLLCLAFTVGFRLNMGSSCLMTVATILFGVFSVCLIVAGLFSTDPHLGYPPGVPAGRTTTHGTIHGIAGLLDFVSIAAVAILMGFYFAREQSWRRWSAPSILIGVLILMLFVIFNVTATMDITGDWPNAPTGLVQRVAIVLGWGWLAAVAIKLAVTQPSVVFNQ
jgi:uncharacterized protein DUF998